jgi:GT2 family glycosyltransferase
MGRINTTDNCTQLSIIIINYNTFRLTCSCIESVIKQTSGLNYEIILVDNASAECSPDLFSEKFPQIRLIKSASNLGFAGGNNLGIANASGDVILLLNSDTELLGNACLTAFEYLSVHPETGIVTGKLLYPDKKVQNNCQKFPSNYSLLFELFRLQKLFPATGEKMLQGSFFAYDRIFHPDWTWGTFFMFRRSDMMKLKGAKLAEDFFMYGEDLLWCLEFRRLGLKTTFLPQVEILHLMGGSNGDKEALIELSNKKLLEKYYSPVFIMFNSFLKKVLKLSTGG